MLTLPFVKSSYDLGKILGFPVRVHLTLLLLLGFIGIAGSGLIGVFMTVLAFASVLAHELGHAVIARRLDVPIAGITLFPFGGVAHLAGQPKRPEHEIAIAIAGPVVSLGLGIGLWFLGGVTGAGWITQLGVFNGIVGLFNLIPALPMDGGRVLRAGLSMRMGHRKATRISTRLARGIAVVMALTAFFTDLWMLLIAGFVWWMAGVEDRNAEATVPAAS